MFSNAINKLGISFSVICAIHCLVFPILLVLIPSVSALVVYEEMLHETIWWVVLPTCALSLILACHKHGNNPAVIVPISLAGIGTVILLGTAVYALSPSANELIERAGILVAGVIIGVSHFMNYTLCREDTCHNH